MRGPTLAIVLSSLIGCTTAAPTEDSAPPAPSPSSETPPLPTPTPPAIAATGTLGERVLPAVSYTHLTLPTKA